MKRLDEEKAEQIKVEIVDISRSYIQMSAYVNGIQDFLSKSVDSSNANERYNKLYDYCVALNESLLVQLDENKIKLREVFIQTKELYEELDNG